MHCMEVWGGSQLTKQGVEFGGLDACVYSKPYGGARQGGDVYYASNCATGRISRLLLADVAGHGAAVASTAADLRTLMRRFVNRLDQSEFVRLLNQQFAALSKKGAFATAIVATYFEPSRRLTVCNAGHPRPLIYRAAQQKWDFLCHESKNCHAVPHNIPFGLLDFSEYEQFDLELKPGDRVLTYTDALMESSDADGEMLGEEGVLRIVRLIGDEPPQTLIDELLREIDSRAAEDLSADDVTVMIFTATGRHPRVSLSEKANAFFRLLKSFVTPDPVPLPDASIPNIGGAIIPALARRWRAHS